MNGRFDLYRGVHKGLRRMLFHTTERLGAADWTTAEAADAVARVRAAIDLLHHHAASEAAHIHRAVEARAPGFMADFERDHHAQEAMLAEIEAAAGAIEAADASARPALGHRLYRAFAAFAGDNLQHMDREEGLVNDKLWSLYDDAELGRVQGGIIGGMSGEVLEGFLGWMLPAMGPQERAGLLRALGREEAALPLAS